MRDIEIAPSYFFWHPHHALFTPTAWLLWRAFRLIVPSVHCDGLVMLLNSLAAVFGGVTLYGLVKRFTGSGLAAFCSAALLILNHATWRYSLEVDVYAFSLFWLSLVLGALCELATRPRPRTAAMLGFFVGMAALYHQANGLLVPAVAVAALLAPLPWHERLKRLAFAGLAAGTVAGFGYLIIGAGIKGHRSFDDLGQWMFSLIRLDVGGHDHSLRDIAIGLADTLDPARPLLGWAAIVAVLSLGLPSAFRKWPGVVTPCAVWIVAYAGFFIWWEPRNIVFWIATLLPLWFLVGLSISRIAAYLARQGNARRATQIALAVCAIPLYAGWNNLSTIVNEGRDWHQKQLQTAAALLEFTSSADMIASADRTLEQYLDYYYQRRHLQRLDASERRDRPDVAAVHARRLAADLEDGSALLLGREAFEADVSLALLPAATRTPGAPGHASPRSGEPLPDPFWEPYRTALTPALRTGKEVEFWRIPSASELAAGAGWRWQGFAWGWDADNVDAQKFDGAWCFLHRLPPILLSPKLFVAGSRIKYVQVKMATDAASAARGELFLFTSVDGHSTSPRSVQWPLVPDGTMRVYTLPLTTAGEARATITRLRLQPVGAVNEPVPRQTCIESLRMMLD